VPKVLSKVKVHWTETQTLKNEFGFDATLYTYNCERVIAYRGTNDVYDAALDDRQIYQGREPDQFGPALAFARKHGKTGAQVYLTGHSLGGALALMVGAAMNLPAVAFNAPGVLRSCTKAAVRQASPAMAARCRKSLRHINIRISGDPVSDWGQTGSQVGGEVRTYKSGKKCSWLRKHKMDLCLAVVKQHPENFRDLGKM